MFELLSALLLQLFIFNVSNTAAAQSVSLKTFNAKQPLFRWFNLKNMMGIRTFFGNRKGSKPWKGLQGHATGSEQRGYGYRDGYQESDEGGICMYIYTLHLVNMYVLNF